MGKTQYYTATSLDGFLADAAGSLDWLDEAAAGAPEDNRFAEFWAGLGAMVMGATTYSWVLEHEGMLADPGKWRHYHGDLPCWVFTHRDLPAVPGAPLTFVQGDVAGVYPQIARAAGDRNIWLAGGGDLAGQFADHGLLDEICLGVAPVTLGGGAPLLPRRLPASRLKLTSASDNGRFVFLTYQVTGSRDTG